MKLTSKGPVFYRSERIGLDGKPFEMIKFRTMVDGADKQVDKLAALNESEGGVLFKMQRRSADHAGRAHPAQVQHRRAAAVHQRAAPRHERRRPAPAAAP